jgi:hypothetical protein
MIKLKKRSQQREEPLLNFIERVRFEPRLVSTVPYALASKTPGHLRFGHIALYCRAKPCINQSLPLQHVAPPSAVTKEEDATTTSVSVQSVLAERPNYFALSCKVALHGFGAFWHKRRLLLAGSLLCLLSLRWSDSLIVPQTGLRLISSAVSPGRPCTPELPATPTVSMNEATIEIVAPVLQIMPELLEKCGEPSSPTSMKHTVVDSPKASAMHLTPTPTTPLEPTQPLAFLKRGDLDVVVPCSPDSTREEVSVDDEVVVSHA